jgi:tripartite-type tricarboxylate transporter receptor subunit TctC
LTLPVIVVRTSAVLASGGEFQGSNYDDGIAAPARVPPEVVARVGQAIGEIADLPDVQNRMSTLGLNFDFRNSEQFRELIVRDHQKYGAVIREAGIQID